MASKLQWVTLIPIRNMNRAIKFYTKVLGGRVTARGRGSMRNFWASVEVGDSPLWLVAPEKLEKRTLAYSLLLVRNIKSTVTRLKSRGVKFKRAARASEETRMEGPIAYESFGASAFFKDSEGNLLMVWQNFPPM